MSIRSIFYDATQLPVNYFRDGGGDGGGRRGHSIPDADASHRWHPVLPVIDRFAIKHEMLKSQKSRGGILGRFLQFCNYFRFWNSNSGPSLRTGYGTPNAFITWKPGAAIWPSDAIKGIFARLCSSRVQNGC